MTASEEQPPLNNNDQVVSRPEDILLKRLQNSPDQSRSLETLKFVAVISVIVVVGGLLWLVTRSTDEFAGSPKQPHNHTQEHLQTESPHQDSSVLMSKRLQYAALIDSLERQVSTNPKDMQATLTLANAYYDTEQWQQAVTFYRNYTSSNPTNVDARVDYAFSIAQATSDFKLAVLEIENALKYDTAHLNGLFNAGILSLRANIENKEKAVSEARSYFKRAEQIAKDNNPQMHAQIKLILTEIDRIEEGEEIPK